MKNVILINFGIITNVMPRHHSYVMSLAQLCNHRNTVDEIRIANNHHHLHHILLIFIKR